MVQLDWWFFLPCSLLTTRVLPRGEMNTHQSEQTPVNDIARSMMTSSNGNIFHVTGPLCREFTGHRWIPLTKANDAELWCFLWSVPWINSWVNNREAGDLRRHRANYEVIVMSWWKNISTEILLCASLVNTFRNFVLFSDVPILCDTSSLCLCSSWWDFSKLIHYMKKWC